MTSKINWLLQNTAPGSLVLQNWLTRNNISPSLAFKYSQNGWLEKLRAGVYVRAGREPDWSDALWCLQNQLEASVYLAGLSSLSWQGRSHYLQLKQSQCWISVESKTILPKWFKEFSHIEWLTLSALKLPQLDEKYRTQLEIKGKKITASVPELAAYELLSAVPKEISFEHAAELFQGLVNLNPRKVENLLTLSQSVRTKRLYLFFASFYEHAWFKRVDTSKIDLGSGNRQLVVNGKLDTQYLITVPENFTKKGISHG
ncbi:type IV toxin-antitoxin system AbiEi family antitoxin [Pantoea dispersa]|uniref:type IV toxin-antitoxin system AbiEi family antitoxin n=1 Tax=Pantoea dispersa TaxID=59814 RepID=UPI0021C6F155|nr:type IV toxin-antitoxin system AbiEi family antitoxin [Pantoea dispersa]UXO69009.1 type IV toxin-antitoxin system AbiEi family antitoxin [Pantoea dispersa]